MPAALQTFPVGRKKPTETGLEAGSWPNLNTPQLAQFAQATFGQGQIAVALVGPDSRIQHASQALANLLRCSKKELSGKNLDRLIHGPWKTPKQRKRKTSSSKEHRETPPVFQVQRKSESTIACHVDSLAIHDENGNVTHFLVFFTEAVAERAGFENELYRAQAMKTLGMLAGGVAHDFNNALEVIIGFATLAQIRLSSADPLHEPLKIIEESAKSAADLARQLLDVSRDDADNGEPIDAGDLVGIVVSIVTRTFDRKIRIHHRIASQLPSVNARRSRLQQAILNLCLNARDAMEEGGKLSIEVSLQTLKPGDDRLPDSKASGHYVCITVGDTGKGMPAEIMKKIFVPQFSTKGRGYGLGLCMVDRIVKEAKGFISVSSQPKKGSEFSVYLPAVFDKQPRRATSSPGKMLAGRGSVLVVDDEPRVLEFLEKGLTRLGYKVVTAESGSSACEIYSRKSDDFNCVLLDLIMPGMSGLETYSRLKGINPGVKVILSSGYSSGRLRREALEAGDPEFLEKPFTLEELSQALQKIHQN